jgi:hypothetical protein
LRVLVWRRRRHRDRHGLAGTSCRAKSVTDGRQTNPNAVSGKHLASFAMKSASLAAAKNPLVARMREKGGTAEELPRSGRGQAGPRHVPPAIDGTVPTSATRHSRQPRSASAGPPAGRWQRLA